MSLIARAYVETVRKTWDLRQRMADLVRFTDARLSHDEELRRSELRKVQREFYKAILADILIRDESEFAELPHRELMAHAEQILDKKGYVAGRSARRENRRTYREHQHYGTLRVRWLELIKAAGIRAIDSRGG